MGAAQATCVFGGVGNTKNHHVPNSSSKFTVHYVTGQAVNKVEKATGDSCSETYIQHFASGELRILFPNVQSAYQDSANGAQPALMWEGHKRQPVVRAA